MLSASPSDALAQSRRLVAMDITNPQSWNRYAYVKNNPLGRVDPSGLNDMPWFGAPWYGPGMYAGGGFGPMGAPFYGGGFACTLDGLPCATTTGLNFGLGGNGFSYCPQCGNPWQPSGIGADNHVYEWLASGQPQNGAECTYCSATGYDWVDVGAASILPPIATLQYQTIASGPSGLGLPTVAVYHPPLPTISSPEPSIPGQQRGRCIIDALNANNGLGLPTDQPPSSSDSIANAIVFQQGTQVGLRTMNPSAANIAALNPLGAPGIFVQSSYYSCMGGH